jgi:hypothetical protein
MKIVLTETRLASRAGSSMCPNAFLAGSIFCQGDSAAGRRVYKLFFNSKLRIATSGPPSFAATDRRRTV